MFGAYADITHEIYSSQGDENAIKLLAAKSIKASNFCFKLP